jgi:hypothetical protein
VGAGANAGLVETGLGITDAVGGAFVSGVIAGTYASGGDLGAGLQQGAFAAAFAFVGTDAGFGELTKLTPERLLAHALLGCAQGAASGGECGASAAAAAFGKIATHGLDGLPGPVQFAGMAFVGGTASVIGGGKFVNGAAQAAFGYLFNHLVSVGLNARAPIVGGVRFSVGVSFHNRELDVGVMIESDIPVPTAGNKFVLKGALDYGYQTGDFASARGTSHRTDFQLGKIGGSVQTDEKGNVGFTVSDPRLSFGVGVSSGPQHTTTNSWRLRDCAYCAKIVDFFTKR